MVVLLAIVHPGSGTSLTLCPSRLLLEAPCPGCGLTRSLSCAIRGSLAPSIQHHPFGPLLAAAAIAVAGLSLLPPPLQARAVGRVALSRPSRLLVATALLGGLLAFGILRVTV